MRTSSVVAKDNVGSILRQALESGDGLLRLTPTWVPRSFLHPGRRIKLHPGDYYAYGAHRGGIDERWFASTTEAANEGRVPDEGLSYVAFGGQRFLLRDAVAEELFVHAQTVRYRVGQLREVYGDRLEDPAFVLDATLALA